MLVSNHKNINIEPSHKFNPQTAHEFKSRLYLLIGSKDQCTAAAFCELAESAINSSHVNTRKQASLIFFRTKECLNPRSSTVLGELVALGKWDVLEQFISKVWVDFSKRTLHMSRQEVLRQVFKDNIVLFGAGTIRDFVLRYKDDLGNIQDLIPSSAVKLKLLSLETIWLLYSENLISIQYTADELVLYLNHDRNAIISVVALSENKLLLAELMPYMSDQLNAEDLSGLTNLLFVNNVQLAHFKFASRSIKFQFLKVLLVKGLVKLHEHLVMQEVTQAEMEAYAEGYRESNTFMHVMNHHEFFLGEVKAPEVSSEDYINYIFRDVHRYMNIDQLSESVGIFKWSNICCRKNFNIESYYSMRRYFRAFLRQICHSTQDAEKFIKRRNALLNSFLNEVVEMYFQGVEGGAYTVVQAGFYCRPILLELASTFQQRVDFLLEFSKYLWELIQSKRLHERHNAAKVLEGLSELFDDLYVNASGEIFWLPLILPNYARLAADPGEYHHLVNVFQDTIHKPPHPGHWPFDEVEPIKMLPEPAVPAVLIPHKGASFALQIAATCLDSRWATLLAYCKRREVEKPNPSSDELKAQGYVLTEEQTLRYSCGIGLDLPPQVAVRLHGKLFDLRYLLQHSKIATDFNKPLYDQLRNLPSYTKVLDPLRRDNNFVLASIEPALDIQDEISQIVRDAAKRAAAKPAEAAFAPGSAVPMEVADEKTQFGYAARAAVGGPGLFAFKRKPVEAAAPEVVAEAIAPADAIKKYKAEAVEGTKAQPSRQSPL